MNRTTVLVMLSVSLLLLGLASALQAQGTCSIATLSGAYRYTYSGFGFGLLPRTGTSLPFAAAGIMTANGDGTLSGTDTASLAGEILLRVYTGTYTVNADCTGSLTRNFSSPSTGSGDSNFVISPDGSEVLTIDSNEGSTVLGEFQRQ